MKTENFIYVQWIVKFYNFAYLEFGSLCLGALYQHQVPTTGGPQTPSGHLPLGLLTAEV